MKVDSLHFYTTDMPGYRLRLDCGTRRNLLNSIRINKKRQLRVLKSIEINPMRQFTEISLLKQLHCNTHSAIHIQEYIRWDTGGEIEVSIEVSA